MTLNAFKENIILYIAVHIILNEKFYSLILGILITVNLHKKKIDTFHLLCTQLLWVSLGLGMLWEKAQVELQELREDFKKVIK